MLFTILPPELQALFICRALWVRELARGLMDTCRARGVFDGIL